MLKLPPDCLPAPGAPPPRPLCSACSRENAAGRAGSDDADSGLEGGLAGSAFDRHMHAFDRQLHASSSNPNLLAGLASLYPGWGPQSSTAAAAAAAAAAVAAVASGTAAFPPLPDPLQQQALWARSSTGAASAMDHSATAVHLFGTLGSLQAPPAGSAAVGASGIAAPASKPTPTPPSVTPPLPAQRAGQAAAPDAAQPPGAQPAGQAAQPAQKEQGSKVGLACAACCLCGTPLVAPPPAQHPALLCLPVRQALGMLPAAEPPASACPSLPAEYRRRQRRWWQHRRGAAGACPWRRRPRAARRPAGRRQGAAG